MIFMFCAAGLLTAQTTPAKMDASAALQAELLKIVETSDDAMMTRDAKVLESSLADSFIHVNPFGGLNGKSGYLKLPKMEVTITSSGSRKNYAFKTPVEGRLTIEKSDFQIRDYGSAALLVMTETISAEPKEMAPQSPQRVSYLFTKNNGRWQLAAVQRTVIKN